MIESINYFFSGIVLGLVGGISPCPLLTLVITETLKHNRKEGIKVAIAPLITDLPIILITIFILSKLSNHNQILGIISILGGIFILYLAYESIAIKSIKLNLHKVKSQSYMKGIIANFLSPHPYIFWMLVGAPTIFKAYQINLLSPILFIFGFYLLLVGSKIFIAILSEKSKNILNSAAYVYTIRILGIILIVFAAFLIKEGLNYIGVL